MGREVTFSRLILKTNLVNMPTVKKRIYFDHVVRVDGSTKRNSIETKKKIGKILFYTVGITIFTMLFFFLLELATKL